MTKKHQKMTKKHQKMTKNYQKLKLSNLENLLFFFNYLLN